MDTEAAKSDQGQPKPGPRYRNRQKNKTNRKQKQQQGQGQSNSQPNASSSPGTSNKMAKKGQRMRMKQKISAVSKERVPMRPIEKVCSNFMKSQCFVEKCPFSHLIKPKRTQSCKFWLGDRCHKGETCHYSHSTPCKFYHLYNYCQSGPDCKFSHERPLTEMSMKVLIKESQLDMPPKILEYDFNQTVSKYAPSKLSRSASTPTSEPTSTPPVPKLIATAIIEDTKSSAENATAPQGHQSFSLSGFYQETLDSDEENHLKIDDSAKDIKTDESSTDPKNDVPIIHGRLTEEVNYSVNFAARSQVNYSALRESLLPALTLIDPRLRHGPRPVQILTKHTIEDDSQVVS